MARRAHESIRQSLEPCQCGEATYWSAADARGEIAEAEGCYLLAGFDHYLLGYADRSLVLDARHTSKVITSNGLFRPVMVVDGKILGTWKQAATRPGAEVEIEYQPFARTPVGRLRTRFAQEAERYRKFLGAAEAPGREDLT